MTHPLHYYIGRDFCWFVPRREYRRVRIVLPAEQVGIAWVFEIIDGPRAGERVAIPASELQLWDRMGTATMDEE